MKKKTVVLYRGSTSEKLIKPPGPPTGVYLYRLLLQLLADQEGVVIDYRIEGEVDDDE